MDIKLEVFKLSLFEENILKILRRFCPDDNLSMPIFRRHIKKKFVDFTLPFNAVPAPLNLPPLLSEVDWSSLRPMAHVSLTSVGLAINLNRPVVYRNLFHNLSDHLNLRRSQVHMVLNWEPLCDMNSSSCDLNTLRGAIILDHIVMLAEACGNLVQVLHPALPQPMRTCLTSVGARTLNESTLYGDVNDVYARVSASQFSLMQLPQDTATNSDAAYMNPVPNDRNEFLEAPRKALDSLEAHCTDYMTGACQVDLAAYLQQKSHACAYNRCITKMKVNKLDRRLAQVARLMNVDWESRPVKCHDNEQPHDPHTHYACREAKRLRPSEAVDSVARGSKCVAHAYVEATHLEPLAVPPRRVCCHVVAHASELSQQQCDILWRLADPRAETVTQCHVVHGAVVCGEQQLSGCELLQLRRDQLRHAVRLKHGTGSPGDGEAMVNSLVEAAVKFEVLMISCKRQLRVSVHDAESRPGVFVMYNCARLAALHDRFLAEVAAGKYPSMPPLDAIAWNTLGDSEWDLMFRYVLPYPDMVHSTIPDFASDSLKPSIHSHKVCVFLHNLSRDLSSYYRHTRVLCGAGEHLLPVMFARLSLLRGVHTVIRHGLGLLNINPPTQL